EAKATGSLLCQGVFGRDGTPSQQLKLDGRLRYKLQFETVLLVRRLELNANRARDKRTVLVLAWKAWHRYAHVDIVGHLYAVPPCLRLALYLWSL
ncbi:MAG: hypothetical protein QF886_20430, partial [Planctomycetota bacterium]|nr:hypothetical protein [Planctomycetota bacterium]